MNVFSPNPGSGRKLTGFSLAYNHSSDLIFMKTEYYHIGYLNNNSAPGGAYFTPAGFFVKSRDSDYHFEVFKLSGNGTCSSDQMAEYARRWKGYVVTGDEKEYYWGLITAAHPFECCPCCSDGTLACECNGKMVRCDYETDSGRCWNGQVPLNIRGTQTYTCGRCKSYPGWVWCRHCKGSGRRQCRWCNGSARASEEIWKSEMDGKPLW